MNYLQKWKARKEYHTIMESIQKAMDDHHYDEPPKTERLELYIHRLGWELLVESGKENLEPSESKAGEEIVTTDGAFFYFFVNGKQIGKVPIPDPRLAALFALSQMQYRRRIADAEEKLKLANDYPTFNPNNVYDPDNKFPLGYIDMLKEWDKECRQKSYWREERSVLWEENDRLHRYIDSILREPPKDGQQKNEKSSGRQNIPLCRRKSKSSGAN